MEITNMTWEDYHKMEKPVLKFESKINFENLKKGTILVVNPNNTGFKRQAFYEKSKNKTIEFVSMSENGIVKCITEDGNHLYYNYKNLLINGNNN
jgi:hypothetical protein